MAQQGTSVRQWRGRPRGSERRMPRGGDGAVLFLAARPHHMVAYGASKGGGVRRVGACCYDMQIDARSEVKQTVK